MATGWVKRTNYGYITFGSIIRYKDRILITLSEDVVIDITEEHQFRIIQSGHVLQSFKRDGNEFEIWISDAFDTTSFLKLLQEMVT
jgi:hypothetical protein